MVWCWLKKMSGPTFGNFTKFIKLHSTGSLVSPRDRRAEMCRLSHHKQIGFWIMICYFAGNSPVFPYKNKKGRLIIDTKKVHFLRPCGVQSVQIANYCKSHQHMLCLTWRRAQVMGEGAGRQHKPGAFSVFVRYAAMCPQRGVAVALWSWEGTRGGWRYTRGMARQRGHLAMCRLLSSAGRTLVEVKIILMPLPMAHWQLIGIRVKISGRAKVRRHLVHYLEGWGVKCYDALSQSLRHECFLRGDAGKLGKYDIGSFLPSMNALFLCKYHKYRSQRLDLPPISEDRSEFDVNAALKPEQVVHSNYLNYLNYLICIDLYELLQLFAAERTSPVASAAPIWCAGRPFLPFQLPCHWSLQAPRGTALVLRSFPKKNCSIVMEETGRTSQL